MKKTVVLVLCLSVLAVWAFANGTSESGSASSSSQPQTVKYSFWGNPDAIGVEDDIIKAFEAANSSINIVPVVSGYTDYHTKLLTLIAGGSAPDVMRVDSYFFGDFLQAGALRQIDDLVKRDNIDMSKYYPEGVEENSHDGKLYGLPWGTAPLYMMLNLKVFRDAGVSLPSMDWNWDDFVKLVKELTKGTGADKQYGFAMNVTGLSSFLPFVWANGGDLFNKDRTQFTLDQPEAYDAIQKLADLYQQGYMPQDSLDANSDVFDRWFVNNKLAMYQGAASEILTVQKVEGTEFEAWPYPNGKIKKTTVYKSNIVGISPQTKVLEPAWTFLKFLRGPSGQGEALYMKAHRIPPTIDGANYWAMYADPNKYPKQIARNTTLISDTYGRLLPLRAGWLEVQQLTTPVFESVFLGQKTAKQGMTELAPQVAAVLKKTASK